MDNPSLKPLIPPYSDLNANTVNLTDGVRSRKTSTGFVLETIDSDGNWNRCGPYVDLGMVNLRDALVYGRSRPLIPYANGRLIKSVSFVPPATLASSGADFSFLTPNTTPQNGFGYLAGDSLSNSTDTVGLYKATAGGVAILLDGNVGRFCQILDCGPLVGIDGTWSSRNFGQPLQLWQANIPLCLGDSILDVNGHVQYVTTNGVTGGSLPTFDTSGGTTSDGTVTWTDSGLAETGEVHTIVEVIEGVSPMPPFPLTLEWVTPPSDTTAGNPIPDFSAILKDQFGNPYTFGPGLFVNVAILGAGTLSSTTGQINAATGIVTFSGFSIAESGTGYILRIILEPTLVTDPIFSPPFNVAP